MDKRDIDLERVVDDPVYRRMVIRELNGQAAPDAGRNPARDHRTPPPGKPGPGAGDNRISGD